MSREERDRVQRDVRVEGWRKPADADAVNRFSSRSSGLSLATPRPKCRPLSEMRSTTKGARVQLSKGRTSPTSSRSALPGGAHVRAADACMRSRGFFRHVSSRPIVGTTARSSATSSRRQRVEVRALLRRNRGRDQQTRWRLEDPSISRRAGLSMPRRGNPRTDSSSRKGVDIPIRIPPRNSGSSTRRIGLVPARRGSLPETASARMPRAERSPRRQHGPTRHPSRSLAKSLRKAVDPRPDAVTFDPQPSISSPSAATARSSCSPGPTASGGRVGEREDAGGVRARRPGVSADRGSPAARGGAGGGRRPKAPASQAGSIAAITLRDAMSSAGVGAETTRRGNARFRPQRRGGVYLVRPTCAPDSRSPAATLRQASRAAARGFANSLREARWTAPTSGRPDAEEAE